MHAARALQGAVVCFGSLQAVAIEVASFLTRNGLPFLVKGKMSSSMARERPALCAGDPSRISENSNGKRDWGGPIQMPCDAFGAPDSVHTLCAAKLVPRLLLKKCAASKILAIGRSDARRFRAGGSSQISTSGFH
jgi:hypothetical protein